MLDQKQIIHFYDLHPGAPAFKWRQDAVGTLSKLCNFVRAYCGQTVEVFVLPCYHSCTSFSSPPPPLELHLRAKSYQSFTYFSFLQTSLRTEKQQRPDNKDSHTRERFGVNTVWVDNPRCNDCKTSWKTHRIEAKEKKD